MKNNSYDKKIFRLLFILNRLANQEIVATTSLAEEFNVTVRTVQRDLELLSMTGFPLSLNNGTYKFEEGFSLRKISVTPEEKFLLMLFYRLFSQTDKPFIDIAKNLLDKVLVSSDKKDILFNEISSKYKKNVLKEEFTNFSDSLAVRLENCKYPQSFVEKVDSYLAKIKEKINALNTKDKVGIKAEFTRQYENNKPVATMWVPKSYFNDNTAKYDFSTHKKEREFTVRTHLPGKFRKSFRISLHLDMFFNFWGVHFKARQITCFDDFAAHLGFPKELKLFDYDSAHGTRGNKHQLLITHGSLNWEKEIPLLREEIKPFLNKKSGIPWSKSWDERKKKWKTIR
ncbi:MAG: HTH domain-containing protein [Candidatus Omnitrophica bacterium]|nr:HTH domain-containing protein [Candidatus Omnitrophota bacterium]